MGKKINLTFITSSNRKSSLSLEDPKEDLTAETVSGVMQSIIQADVFEGPSGDSFAALDKAVIIETTETELF